jgi:hypothetical protein
MIDPRPREDLLEALCFMRNLYARRGAADSETVLTVDAAIAYGEMLMRVGRRRDEARIWRNARSSA